MLEIFNVFSNSMQQQVGFLIWNLIRILILVFTIIIAVVYLSYIERRFIGFFQNRLGPNRVGPFGLLQPVADVLKLFLKEIIIPSRSNRYLYLFAPILALGPALAAWAVIPFDQGLVVSNINVGLLYVFAMTSLAIYGIIIAGWSSNSRYAFLGALRSSAQIISYEIPIGFVLVAVLMAAGSMNLSDIVMAQSGNILHWYCVPLFPLFVIYWISAVAETNRLPFDVAEGESEIVAGFHVEYAGITFGLFFLAEYANMILVSAIVSILFLGGWLSPFQGLPILEPLFAWVPGFVWFYGKISLFIFLFLWFRATFPRFRYDQIMRLGWKVFIPITLIWITFLAFAIACELPPWFVRKT